MAELQEKIRSGQRSQDLLNPQKYRYSKAFGSLDVDNTHIVANTYRYKRSAPVLTIDR